MPRTLIVKSLRRQDDLTIIGIEGFMSTFGLTGMKTAFCV